MAVATVAPGAGTDTGGRRTGDAVPQPARLCAAHLVPGLRPQIHLPELFGLAGGASLSQAARLSSMRLRDCRCLGMSGSARREHADRLRPRRGAGGGRIRAISFPMRAMPSPRPTRCMARRKPRLPSAPFAKREIDVLIGTQIIAKGHHFPQLTLVGVIDADLGGSGRRHARARAHLPVAASGVGPGGTRRKARAGAAADPQSAGRGDAGVGATATATVSMSRNGVYRERAAAPPFGRLAAIVVSGYDGERGARDRAAIGQGRAARHGRESVGPDAGLLCPAARPDARAACWCRPPAAWTCRPICAPGSARKSPPPCASAWMWTRSVFFRDAKLLVVSRCLSGDRNLIICRPWLCGGAFAAKTCGRGPVEGANYAVDNRRLIP